MSMICWILGLSPAQIRALRATPSLATDLARVKQNEIDARLAAVANRMTPEQRAMVEAQYRASLDQIPGMAAFKAQTAEANTRLEAIGPFEQALNLNKSWHILHYVFTGTIVPSGSPADVLLTGKDLGEDVGYGPARLHGTNETREFAAFLATLDARTLQERVNFREMSRLGVYSMPFGPQSDAEFERMLRAEVDNYFSQLRNYVVSTAEKQNGLLVWIS